MHREGMAMTEQESRERTDNLGNTQDAAIDKVDDTAASTRSVGYVRSSETMGAAGMVGRRGRWSTRQLVTMALFIAIGVILSFIEFPLIPGTDFLKYDASAVPAIIIAFAYGPAAGCLVGALTAAIHSFDGNIWGGVMNMAIVMAYVLPAALLYKRSKSTASIIFGLILSCISMVVVAILMNLIITPIYAGIPVEAVISLIIPILLPFNILKSLINSVLAFLVQKSLASFLK